MQTKASERLSSLNALPLDSLRWLSSLQSRYQLDDLQETVGPKQLWEIKPEELQILKNADGEDFMLVRLACRLLLLY